MNKHLAVTRAKHPHSTSRETEAKKEKTGYVTLLLQGPEMKTSTMTTIEEVVLTSIFPFSWLL